MLSRLRAIDDPRIHVIPSAVADFDGTATFYIDENGDHGCSSLYPFVKGIEGRWPGRSDLKATGRVQVPVLRLDTFIREQGIERIDYLHIDAQGADLQVLRGLGAEAERVKAGRVEAATRRATALYRGQPLLPQIEAWLIEHGFVITGKTDNDPWGHEVNVEFRRP